MNLDRLVWLDLETTGLDPQYDSILEIGIVITDRTLTELAARSWVLPIDRDAPTMTDVARRMHEGNGLLRECKQSTLAPHLVELEAIAFIREYGAIGSPLCGSSVHFDRSFLRIDFPELHSQFHYRNFDASAYRIEASLMGREAPPKREAHRSLDDLRESIALARWGMGR